MPKIYALRTAAIAVSLAVSGPALAQDREPVTAKIGYADLDLASVSGQTAFKHRIHMAASRSCQSVLTEVIPANIDRSRCMREMERDGDARIAVLPSRSTQVAVAGMK